ncbi:hypothetical protein BGZ54_002633 [Gamsiella multidivaricata]|nr:hypothetical protein BGZ54_002633 [Gamsiella multidivaricata]
MPSTQLIAELFQRSHVFRELLVADYSIFLQLTVGIHRNTLPPPKIFAEKTKQLAISLTNEWNAKYGAVYKQIALGYDFLKHHLKVDFTNLVPVTEEARSAEQKAQEEMSRRLRQKRYEKAAAEMEERADDIQDNLKKMNSCFEILVPKLDDDAALDAIFSAPTDNNQINSGNKTEEIAGEDTIEEEEVDNSTIINEAMLRHDPIGVFDNALGSNRYKLTINVNRENPVDIAETEDNSELFATLRECYQLIVKKHWPIVMEWLDVLMKADHEPGPQRAEYDRLLKMAIDLKKGVADAKSKSEDLGVNMDTMYGPNERDSDDDNEEFEEVDVSASIHDKKKGKQMKRNNQATLSREPRNPVFAMHGEDILEDDPTYVGGTILPVRDEKTKVTEPKSPSAATHSRAASEVSTPPTEKDDGAAESREELLARAPVIPWDDDLAVWDKKEMAFNTSGLEFSHRFLGVGDGSNLVSQATLDRMKMRTRIYDPQLPKVIKARFESRYQKYNVGFDQQQKYEWTLTLLYSFAQQACRYPMSNGRLCMRRDLVRCPFHGPIVPRDEHGQTQRPTVEGGFIQDENFLNDEQEADLINRAIAAASGSSVSTSSSSKMSKDKSTWEDIEDDVNHALGLEKIESKRKRGQGGGLASKKKKTQKPPSALVNISKPVDTSRTRLLKHLGRKTTKDSVEHDRRSEKSELSKDARMHRW